jgi:hypothetical protein
MRDKTIKEVRRRNVKGNEQDRSRKTTSHGMKDDKRSKMSQCS